MDEAYAYRSIDDVIVRLAPLLAERQLCVLERSVSERQGLAGELLLSVRMPTTSSVPRMAYDIVSAEDGSCHAIEAHGEALDAGDKGTAKAMQSAYKYAMIHAFVIPVSGSGDADASSPKLRSSTLSCGPVQG